MDRLMAAIALLPEMRSYLNDKAPWRYSTTDMETIIAALEASKPLLAGGVMISTADFEAIGHLSKPSEYRMPDEAVKNLEAIYSHHLKPLTASPAPATMGNEAVVERVAKAICFKVHEGADYGMDGSASWDKPHARKHFMGLATAALAALNHREGE